MPFHPSENLSRCPFCSKRSLLVHESRLVPTTNTRRRRYRCNKCTQRLTLYEVSEKFYSDALENQRIVNHIKHLFAVSTLDSFVSNVTFSLCDDCVCNKRNQCTKDIPEYNTNESHDCIYYEAVSKKTKQTIGS